MARLARAEIFDPSEIVAVHLIGKTVRSCWPKPIISNRGAGNQYFTITDQILRIAVEPALVR